MADAQRPSFDQLRAQAEQADRRLLALRRQQEDRTFAAQDDWGVVEVVVNGRGEVVEVAVNDGLTHQVAARDLAESMLQAARAAQQLSRADRDR